MDWTGFSFLRDSVSNAIGSLPGPFSSSLWNLSAVAPSSAPSGAPAEVGEESHGGFVPMRFIEEVHDEAEEPAAEQVATGRSDRVTRKAQTMAGRSARRAEKKGEESEEVDEEADEDEQVDLDADDEYREEWGDEEEEKEASRKRGEKAAREPEAAEGGEKKRRREGDYRDVTHMLTLPQGEAAASLGLTVSTFCKRWKESVGERKWPFRTIGKIDKEVALLRKRAPSKNTDAKIAALLKQREACLLPAQIRFN